METKLSCYKLELISLPADLINTPLVLVSSLVSWTNQRPVSRSRDHSGPIRGQQPGQLSTAAGSSAIKANLSGMGGD